MKIFRSFAIAFAAYSRIPMPIFEWKEEDMRYVLIFFPWVGAVIAALFMLWYRVSGNGYLGINENARTLILAALPVIVTGGFHADGFLDTMDALHSYASKEKKLEIMKDPHIGAFGVIMAILYSVIYIASLSEIAGEAIDAEPVICLAGSFVLSRILSAFSVLYFPKAKKEGSLNTVGNSAGKVTVTAALVLEYIALLAAEMLCCPLYGGLIEAAGILTFVYYYFKSRRVFGGTSGDLAGYFVTLCEIVCAVVTAAAVII